MNALTKWNPFRELEEMQSRLGSLLGRAPWRGLGEETMTVTEWTPLVDITEDDKEYLDGGFVRDQRDKGWFEVIARRGHRLIPKIQNERFDRDFEDFNRGDLLRSR